MGANPKTGTSTEGVAWRAEVHDTANKRVTISLPGSKSKTYKLTATPSDEKVAQLAQIFVTNSLS